MDTFQLVEDQSEDPDQNNLVNIKVIGVGGGGGNAVIHMVETGVEGVEFICANTDAQVLNRITPEVIKLQIGASLTDGLGAGANPEVGRDSAEEDNERIARLLEGSNMVFVAAGMGGGTGTGAAPVVARIAREMGILTVGVVTKPFSFEGKKRMDIANAGIAELTEYVNSLVVIPNEKLLPTLGKAVTLQDAFSAANDVLRSAVQGITDIMVRPSLINVDFADVRTVMLERGKAMMGTGRATGEHRAREAATRALSCPLLEDIDMKGARGILANITAGSSIMLTEHMEVGELINEIASPDATIVIGTAIDESMGDDLQVTVVATGLEPPKPASSEPSFSFGAQTETPAQEAPVQKPVVREQEAVREPVHEEAEAAAPSRATASAVREKVNTSQVTIPPFIRRRREGTD